MISQVFSGAMLGCSCGLSPGALIAGARAVRHTQGPALATIADCLPLANVPPFGGCTAPANPSPLVPKPCTPQLVAPWSAAVPGVTVEHVPALASTAVLTCLYGGSISIVQPGAPGVFLLPGGAAAGAAPEEGP